MKISLDIGQRDSGHLVVSSAARRPDTELAISRRMRWNEAMGKRLLAVFQLADFLYQSFGSGQAFGPVLRHERFGPLLRRASEHHSYFPPERPAPLVRAGFSAAVRCSLWLPLYA